MSLFRNALYLVQFGVVKMTLQALLKTDCVDLKQLEFEEQRRAVRSHRKQEQYLEKNGTSIKKLYFR